MTRCPRARVPLGLAAVATLGALAVWHSHTTCVPTVSVSVTAELLVSGLPLSPQTLLTDGATTEGRDVCFISIACSGDGNEEAKLAYGKDFSSNAGLSARLLFLAPQLLMCEAQERDVFIHWDRRYFQHSKPDQIHVDQGVGVQTSTTTLPPEPLQRWLDCGSHNNCWTLVGVKHVDPRRVTGRKGLCASTNPEGPSVNTMCGKRVARALHTRQVLGSVLRRHVQPDAATQAQVDAFASKHFAGVNVLAVVIRATDYADELKGWKAEGDPLSHPDCVSTGTSLVPTDRWIAQARAHLEMLPEPRRIFVAADNEASVAAMVAAFPPGTVVHTSADRTVGYGNGEDNDWFHCNDAEYHPTETDRVVHPWINRTCLRKQWRDILTEAQLVGSAERLLYWEGSMAKLAMLLHPSLPAWSVLDPTDTFHAAPLATPGVSAANRTAQMAATTVGARTAGREEVEAVPLGTDECRRVEEWVSATRGGCTVDGVSRCQNEARQYGITTSHFNSS
eukprot:m.73474 g.73474  ORF g.73474 m.73474 type:complete len:506 (-) comp10227_c0_seq1:3-1520(-)